MARSEAWAPATGQPPCKPHSPPPPPSAGGVAWGRSLTVLIQRVLVGKVGTLRRRQCCCLRQRAGEEMREEVGQPSRELAPGECSP